MRKSPNVITIV